MPSGLDTCALILISVALNNHYRCDLIHCLMLGDNASLEVR